MFFSQDLLCRRNGRFGAVWLLGTAAGGSRRQCLSSKEVATINIPRTCAEIVAPLTPLSLRLASALLVGLTRALARQSHTLLVDCHSTWARILATPWITSRRGFDPFILAAVTTSSVHAITLPWEASLEYLGLPVDVDMATACAPSARLQHWGLLGWLGPAGDPRTDAPRSVEMEASAASFTSSWSSLSIPEPRRHHHVPSSPGPASPLPGAYPSDLAPLLANDALPLVASQGSISSGDRFEDDAILDMGLGSSATPDFLFDADGNLRFAPSDASDVHTEVLAQLAHSVGASAATPAAFAAVPLRVGASHAPKRGHDNDTEGEPPGAAKRGRHGLDGDMQAQVWPGSTVRLLEEIECEVAHRWEDAATGRRASSTAGRQRRTAWEPADAHGQLAHVPQVAALWSGSCYWDRHVRAKTTAALCKRITSCIQRRAAALADVHTVPGGPAASHLLGPYRPAGYLAVHERAASPLSDGVLEEVAGASDVELGRGGSPDVAMADGASNSGSLDIRLDIPWLNPAVLAEVRRPRSGAGTPSLFAEPGDAVEPRTHPALSRQSTPASRVPSVDPPSSDEGLGIQPFDLAAPALEAGTAAGSDLGGRGLDSFLDASMTSTSPSEDAYGLPMAGMTRDTRSFCQYVLAKKHGAGADRIFFGELLEPPFRSRRVAARAFVDLLQTVSCSAFGVVQEAPYAEITIIVH